MLSDDNWEKWELGDPQNPNSKWISLCWAYTELGMVMTGLPIDFQIQQVSYANERYGNRSRSSLGFLKRK